MAELIGGYRPLSSMKTAGSGSARWCFAMRGLDRFFLKEFLTPVWPVQENTPLGQKQCDRCERFEDQKQRLYAAASCVIGDTLVPVIDFFQFERKYYAVSEAMADGCQTAETAENLSEEQKQKLLYELALCLQRLHTQGVVHADLKPDHVLLMQEAEGWRARLIDLDSGFLVSDPPVHSREMEGDPVYLAPEAFLRMIGQEAVLGPKLDTFAFGAMIHRVWTGALPGFDAERYHYLYEAALDRATIHLSESLPEKYRAVVLRMLAAEPEDRPEDAEITALFDAPMPRLRSRSARPVNGLMSRMHSREDNQ